ncbi:hypothetical protein JL720_6563 [Aureococcus anophagefferens]|nr:hypothetical protein JL720_6563 [Aureococcus anophagefferens]
MVDSSPGQQPLAELVCTYEGAPGGFALKMRLPPRTTAGKVVDGYCKQYAKKGHGALAPQALVLDCDGVHLPREAAVPAGARVAVVRAGGAAVALSAADAFEAKIARAERCGDYAGAVHYYGRLLAALRRGAGAGSADVARRASAARRSCLVDFAKAVVYAAELDHDTPEDLDPTLLRPAFCTRATIAEAREACGDKASPTESREALVASREAPFRPLVRAMLDALDRRNEVLAPAFRQLDVARALGASAAARSGAAPGAVVVALGGGLGETARAASATAARVVVVENRYTRRRRRNCRACWTTLLGAAPASGPPDIVRNDAHARVSRAVTVVDVDLMAILRGAPLSTPGAVAFPGSTGGIRDAVVTWVDAYESDGEAFASVQYVEPFRAAGREAVLPCAASSTRLWFEAPERGGVVFRRPGAGCDVPWGLFRANEWHFGMLDAVVGEGERVPDPHWLPFCEEGKYVDLYRSRFSVLTRGVRAGRGVRFDAARGGAALDLGAEVAGTCNGVAIYWDADLVEGADDDCADERAAQGADVLAPLVPRAAAAARRPGGDPPHLDRLRRGPAPRARSRVDGRDAPAVCIAALHAGRAPPGPDPPDWSCGRDGTWLRDFAAHGRRGLVVDDLVKARDGAVETSNGSWLKKRKRSDGDEAPEDGDGDVLLLNVGGRSFATTYGTVRSAPGYLANLFKEGSGFRAPTRDADGRFFIDKNPDTFALLKDINVENELEIFYETGVPARSARVGIDKLIDEGYGVHSLFGLKIQLSAFGSHLDNGRGNLRRGECGYIGNLMTHANGIIINVTKNPYWTGIHKARIERVRAGLESYMDTDGTWEWSSRWDPTKLMTA